MSDNLPFGISDDDINAFRKRQATCVVDNHPLRDSGTTFFQALMSDEADAIQHGVISEDAVKLFGDVGEVR